MTQVCSAKNRVRERERGDRPTNSNFHLMERVFNRNAGWIENSSCFYSSALCSLLLQRKAATRSDRYAGYTLA